MNNIQKAKKNFITTIPETKEKEILTLKEITKTTTLNPKTIKSILEKLNKECNSDGHKAFTILDKHLTPKQIITINNFIKKELDF